MPKHYRIPVPITLETKHAIEQLAKVTGASLGSTAATFLNEMAPHILRLSEVYSEAKRDPSKGVEMINTMAEEARSGLEEEQLQLLKKVKK